MSRSGWHVQRNGAQLVLARRLPARFDISAEARLPMAGRERVAQQVRQDMWRALRHQRGFSPVVEVTSDAEGLSLRAGGRIDGASYDRARLEALVGDVLDSPGNRSRWLRMARRAGA